MKLLFITDYRFIPDEKTIYSEGFFSQAVWERRYLSIFDSMIVVSRQQSMPEHIHNIDRLNISSHPLVEFRFAPNLSTPTAWFGARQAASNILAQAIDEVDCVIVRLPSALGYLATRIAQKMNKPWVIELDGCPWDGLWNYGSLSGKLYAPVRYWRTKQAVAQAELVRYVTAQFLQERYPNKHGRIIAISNVVIDAPDKNLLTARLLNIRQDREGARIVFGLIGSFVGKHKGIQTVLQALPALRKRVPNIEFRLIGAGDTITWKKMAIQYGVADIVRFDGLLPSGGAVMSWLDDIDIYLQPSLKEGLPRALIEALSRACPAIGSRCAGIPELLHADDLIRPGDYKALAKKMEMGATSPEWRLLAAERNWKTAQSYTQSILDERYQVYAQYLKEMVAD